MLISEAFPSEFLKAGDIGNRQVKVTIAHVEMRDIGDDHKPVLFFQGKEKGVVLNVTNARAIGQYYGEDMDAWVGQEIILFTMMVNFQGRMQPGIRIRVPSPAERTVLAPKTPVQPSRAVPIETENPAPVQPRNEMNDDIPF